MDESRLVCTEAFRAMLTTVEVWRISDERQIMPTYRHAIEAKRSCLIVESLG